MGLEFLVQVAESHRHEHIHSPQQVVLGDAILKPELVEQAILCNPTLAHHCLILHRSLHATESWERWRG